MHANNTIQDNKTRKKPGWTMWGDRQAAVAVDEVEKWKNWKFNRIRFPAFLAARCEPD